jgi:heme exporter protein D
MINKKIINLIPVVKSIVHKLLQKKKLFYNIKNYKNILKKSKK